MTAPASPAIAAAEEQRRSAVRVIAKSLQTASAQLGAPTSIASVRAAERAIDQAERSLGLLATDPWEPALEPLRQAREILSSHLLAAAACAGAEVKPLVTARVLRRGAESAQRVLSSRDSSAGVDPRG